MAKIELEITTCKECPHFSSERYYTADSFEFAFNWYCNKVEKRKIQGYVEWHEESKIKIPDWCPALINNHEDGDEIKQLYYMDDEKPIAIFFNDNALVENKWLELFTICVTAGVYPNKASYQQFIKDMIDGGHLPPDISDHTNTHTLIDIFTNNVIFTGSFDSCHNKKLAKGFGYKIIKIK